MTSLARPLRNALESTVRRGREIAEAAAAEALTYLGVSDPEAPKHLSEDKKAFRVQLRAHARQLGDALHAGKQGTRRLAEEVAYEQWHRLLFTRFLVENNLLIHPDLQDAISMADCEELAAELGKDPWQLAGEFAARMLPQIFRPDDPTQRIELPVNRRKELESLVNGLDRETFLAKDALGWSYQFWQAKRKDDINAAGVKIGADELPAVTQLFTEDYMVEFLLHNSLGAWWVSNFPDRPLPVDMPYLRVVDEEVDNGHGDKKVVRRPAAGAFEGWPKRLRDFTLMDPCCGSGHFPVFALGLLVPMRMALEELTPKEAVDAVLRENIHALEIDARCVEIAVFALALAAWTYPGAGGYRRLPELNVACCGLSISQKEGDWLKLANGDSRLREGMQALYEAFKDAPLLGSLIDPRKAVGGDLYTAGFAELTPSLEAALGKERIRANAESVEAVLAAKGLAKAAALLARQYTLQITNPPYLGKTNQCSTLKAYCEARHPHAKNDLANAFLERCLAGVKPGGTVQFVMPQNWLFLSSYKSLREDLLGEAQWNLLVRLGPGAFDTISGEVVQVILVTLTNALPSATFMCWGLDASDLRPAAAKANRLRFGKLTTRAQADIRLNPDARVSLDERLASSHPPLSAFVVAPQGVITGDADKWKRYFWEVLPSCTGWVGFQSAGDEGSPFSGRSAVVDWRNQGHGMVRPRPDCYAFGRDGVAISQMASVPATLYYGDKFDGNIAPLIPKSAGDLPALWAFVSSSEFKVLVRALDQKLNVTNGSFLQVPFDRDRWEAAAAASYPAGLPKPYSDDPTQWVFHGHPRLSTSPLQVAVTRLAGYRWPAEGGPSMDLSEEAKKLVSSAAELNGHADSDGIVCLPAVKGEKPAAERLVSLLGDAFGKQWSSSLEAKLLAHASCPGMTLEAWLRNSFFAQHCKLFHDRPFIWHVWDGQKDGFAALVNYHKLDKARLEALTYAYLGDWIEQQQRRVAAKADGAKILLAAALNLQENLKLVLAGEAPCDIFVRWRPLEQLPLGWQPDLNDGVRVNIRPFMLCGDVGKKGAGILRDKPNINWKKDRGTDVASAPWFDLGPAYGEEKGARINDHHTTLAEKNKARGAKT